MESIVAATLMGLPASDAARSAACSGSGRSLAPSYRLRSIAAGTDLDQAIKPATAMFDVWTDHRTRRPRGSS
jgi:hypothetical protein